MWNTPKCGEVFRELWCIFRFSSPWKDGFSQSQKVCFFVGSRKNIQRLYSWGVQRGSKTELRLGHIHRYNIYKVWLYYIVRRSTNLLCAPFVYGHSLTAHCKIELRSVVLSVYDFLSPRLVRFKATMSMRNKKEQLPNRSGVGQSDLISLMATGLPFHMARVCVFGRVSNKCAKNEFLTKESLYRELDIAVVYRTHLHKVWAIKIHGLSAIIIPRKARKSHCAEDACTTTGWLFSA